MQSPARLRFCRCGIIALCLLPTATVGGWIAQRSTGQFAIAQATEWERELTDRLGLVVEIEVVSYPSHSLACLENVRLLDPETRALIAQASLIEVLATNAGWQVQAWQPQISAVRLGDLLRTIDQRLLRGATPAAAPCVISAHELLIADADAGQTLLNVSARVESGPQGPMTEFTFYLPIGAVSAASPARLIVARNRQASPPTTLWQLETAGNPLPVTLLAATLPESSRLGRNCRFDGNIALEQSPTDCSGQWHGTLDGVDLDSLVTEHFPHQLSGVATVEIERATIDRGKLVEIRGTMQARDGAVSHTLLAASQEHLRLVLATDNASIQPGRLVPYRQLSLGFALDGRALSLSGSADPTQPGILLANAAGPILQAPPRHAALPVGLLRTLLPLNEYQVPATRQTDALISLLPVPDLAPAQTATRATGHVPTRLAPASPPSTAPAVRQPELR